MFLRLKTDDIPLLKRATKGVKGIKLSSNDYVVSAFVLKDDESMNIDGKQYKLDKLKTGKRGNKGSKLKK